MSDEVRERGRSKGGACSGARSIGPTSDGRSPEGKAKPYGITQLEVLEAFFKVKSNKGAAGIDEQTMEEFERNLKGNLYKLWNRMSSGSYFPPAVRTVMIPKAKGGERAGIPTVADRVAQMVVKNRIEPLVEPLFHPDSFGYRPGKSALDAVGWARQRCWSFDWVCDLDIKGFFDNLNHDDLMMKAVRKHAKGRWVVLYIERWLKAPAQGEDGNLTPRDRGTPQGGVISPLLANLYLHYAFDLWMRKKWQHLPFERYADDIIVHCRGRWEANLVRTKVEKRLRECGLELHPELVYCKDSNRQESHPHEKFDILGLRSDPGRQRRDGAACSAASVRPSRTMRFRNSATRSAAGNCTCVRRSPSQISRRRLTRSFVGGSTTTAL